jgi:hypothetical protein
MKIISTLGCAKYVNWMSGSIMKEEKEFESNVLGCQEFFYFMNETVVEPLKE